MLCDKNWDGVYCWPITVAGKTAEKACSSVLELLRPSYAKYLTGKKTFNDLLMTVTYSHQDKLITNYSRKRYSYLSGERDLVSRKLGAMCGIL